MITLALLLSCRSELPQLDVTSQALGCYALHTDDGYLTAAGSGYTFDTDSLSAATPFHMQPADLGTYLLYDDGAGYLVAEDGAVTRQTSLHSDVTEIEDGYISGGEWTLQTARDGERYQLLSRRTGLLLSEDIDLTDSPSHAAAVTFEPTTGCATFPEMSLDAAGTITETTFSDGDLFGLVDAHSHLMSSYSFGGGGIFHGAAFHRLGVEHALPDCAPYHGEEGRRDFFGYAYDGGGDTALVSALADLLAGELSEPNHATAGYPEFTEWPDALRRTTHQQQYHRWLERAWLSGLRLIVQHATNDESICNLTIGQGLQTARYACDDMTAVDRSIDETYNMQDYIDALHGGEGQGWFRVVTSPEQAREVIAEGRLAVILGIETSNLFRCYLTPREGDPTCDADYVEAQLDAYHERGVRALFPVHKYGNQFSPGDGSSGFLELGSFINSGHWTNKTEECPSEDLKLPGMYDGNPLTFGGLLGPRDDYLSPAPNDLSGFPEAPIETLQPYFADLLDGGIDGAWCQNAGITEIGEVLLEGMMARGMIIEVDHFPQWAYTEVYDLLQERDYPAAGTHHRHWEGRIYELGGVSSMNLDRCQDAKSPGSTTASLAERVALISDRGGYPGLVLGFDFNGFAHGPPPRFGEEGCDTEQPNPMAYPFTSYAGDVEFTEPYLGSRPVDFDTEGMIHIGLLPELIQDARADALSDADLEPLFRGAEAYIRMWERAEARAEALSAGR